MFVEIKINSIESLEMWTYWLIMIMAYWLNMAMAYWLNMIMAC